MHLYNCKLHGLVVMVSLDFKTSWKMFTQRGEYVARMFYIKNEVRVSSAIVKYRDFIVQGSNSKLWGFRPLVVKLAA